MKNKKFCNDMFQNRCKQNEKYLGMILFSLLQNTFYGEAEQALEDLLSLEPAILTSVANDVRNWVPLLPEHVLHMIPHTLLM